LRSAAAPFSARSPAYWLALVAGAIVTNIVSLSVHVGMLQGLNVPFPDRSGVSPVAALLNTALAIFALVTFYDYARVRLAGRPLWQRALIVAALFAGLKELLRGSLMDAVVTTGWTFSAAHILSSTVYSVVLGAVVVGVTLKLQLLWLRAVAAIVIAALMLFAVRPLADALFAPLLASLAHLKHADVYPFPYGWHVLSWAYLTYFEPVIASIIIAALVWPALAGSALRRSMQIMALIVLIKGALLPTFVFSLWNPAGIGPGMLSESQFLFEAVLLGLLAAGTWALTQHCSDTPSGSMP